MGKSKYFDCQVLHKEIEKPVEVGIFHYGKFFHDRRMADEKCLVFSKRLDTAGIDFSVIEKMSSSRVIVSIAEINLAEMEEAGIFREISDPR